MNCWASWSQHYRAGVEMMWKPAWKVLFHFRTSFFENINLMWWCDTSEETEDLRSLKNFRFCFACQISSASLTSAEETLFHSWGDSVKYEACCSFQCLSMYPCELKYLSCSGYWLLHVAWLSGICQLALRDTAGIQQEVQGIGWVEC